eukprot:4359773-Pyramimonas_sp.AAC.1
MKSEAVRARAQPSPRGAAAWQRLPNANVGTRQRGLPSAANECAAGIAAGRCLRVGNARARVGG